MSVMGDIVADGVIESPVQDSGGLNILFTGNASVVADSNLFNTVNGTYEVAALTPSAMKAAMTAANGGPYQGPATSPYSGLPNS